MVEKKSVKKFNKPREKHGMTKTPEHLAWTDMLSRCRNPNVWSYKHYGGKGVKVCAEWQHSFLAFYAYMGPKPDGQSLDRFPNRNGNYEPGNCRWATQSQQMRNTVRTRLFTIGDKTQCLTDWAADYGIMEPTLRTRLDSGMSIEEALAFDNTGTTLTHDGQTKTIKQWSAATGLHATTIRARITDYGWSVSEALTTPPGVRRGSKPSTL